MIGWTLGAYLFRRFSTSIAAVFAAVAALIALLDFIEMFRRLSDIPNGSALEAAYLTALRAPSICEQTLPFVVLAGSMFAFLSLSRRMELIVARAAGVSVWQFLTPPICVGALVGLLSVGAYNPVAALLKQRADAVETSIFGKPGDQNSDAGLWVQQSSVDGQAIIRAGHASDGGAVLADVSVFLFDNDDVYQERVEAARATLLPGRWTLDGAKVYRIGAPPEAHASYILATDLTPAQVTQSFVSPDDVPFWSLPGTIRSTVRAGLDAASYQLQFQTLLARPLTLVAMVLISACFSLRFFRFGGVSKTIAGGVAAGFVLYVVGKIIGDLGGAGLISAPAAAWSPAVVASMLGALFLLHQEDG